MNHKNLYVIGNGFDIHHLIYSRYSDFKEFLSKVDSSLHDHVIKYLLVDEKWCDLEMALAQLDVDYVIDEAMQFLHPYSAEDWSDSFHHNYQYELDRIVSNLSTGLKSMFSEWISQLEIPKAKDIKHQLINLDFDGHCLSFNYTPTLERIYGVNESNILYLHGKSEHSDSDIILGHSWEPEEVPNLNDVPNPEDMDPRIAEGNEIINNYFGNTFKAAEEIIEANQGFWDELKYVENIYILGHSLSEVDLPYFEEISKNVHNDSNWIVTY